MINRQNYQQKIMQKLIALSMQVEANNTISLTDINHNAEHFYCGLLNLVFDYSLVNINVAEPNATSIDLGDKALGVAIQVTSTNGLSKIKDSVNKFVKNKLYEKYNKLIILNIIKKIDRNSSKYGTAEFEIDLKEDVWDIYDLIKKITDIPDTRKLKKIMDFISDELTSPAANVLANEISTIIGIIEYISDESHPAAGAGDAYEKEPFPKEKIYERFSDHSEFLEKKFQESYLEYGGVLDAIKNEADYGQVKIRRASQYLRNYSDSVLNQCNGNPKDALEKILNNFSTILGENGIHFDAGAAEFYIIDQLTRCNVFPISEVQRA